MDHTRKKKRRKMETSQESDQGFRLLRVEMDLPLGPAHSADPRKGVREALDRFLAKYIPSLGFVLVTINFNSLSFNPVARLIDPTANMVLAVTFEGVGWRPSMGSTLTGRLMHSTRSHVSLLLHNVFNAVISSAHIPSDIYHWDPDRVNPHAGPETAMDDFYASRWKEADEEQARVNGKTGLEEEVDDLAINSTASDGELGCWVHTATGEPIGDQDGLVSFKVNGLTIANATIAVHGSLLDDPFSAPVADSMPKLPSPIPERQPIGHTTDAEMANEQADDADVTMELLSPVKEKKKKKKRKSFPPDGPAPDEGDQPSADPKQAAKLLKKKRKTPAEPNALEAHEQPKKRKRRASEVNGDASIVL